MIDVVLALLLLLLLLVMLMHLGAPGPNELVILLLVVLLYNLLLQLLLDSLLIRGYLALQILMMKGDLSSCRLQEKLIRNVFGDDVFETRRRS